MSPVQKRRLIVVVSLIGGLSLSLGLALYALSENINLFYTPSQLFQQNPPKDKILRVGGMVVKNSLTRKGTLVEFTVTDYEHQIRVKYNGILPDLFKEGQGIVVTGKWDNDLILANEVLAKHDEKYMPPEIAALKAKEGRQ